MKEKKTPMTAKTSAAHCSSLKYKKAEMMQKIDTKNVK